VAIDNGLKALYATGLFQDVRISQPGGRLVVTVVENALARLEEEFRHRGKAEEFSVLRRFLPGSAGRMTMEEAARRMGHSVITVKAAIHRLRMKFRTALTSCVAATVSTPEEVHEEMQYLRSLLAGGESPGAPGAQP